MTLHTTIQDIKQLKIQGAQQVAKAAVLEFHSLAKQYQHSPKLFDQLAKAHAALIASRPTEPFLRNCLNSLIHTDAYSSLSFQELERRVHLVLNHITNSDTHIIGIAKTLFPKKANVYTHCHSTTVTRILIAAKQSGKQVIVHNTETRPLFQGRKTATELAKAGILVYHHVDAAIRDALKESDIALLGADAITTKGEVINKIGSELVADTAKHFHVPLYICTNSWKFDPATAHRAEAIEQRSGTEVWDHPPKGVRIHNPAFEIIPPAHITGIISELGIHTPKQFVKVVKKEYPLLSY